MSMEAVSQYGNEWHYLHNSINILSLKHSDDNITREETVKPVLRFLLCEVWSKPCVPTILVAPRQEVIARP